MSSTIAASPGPRPRLSASQNLRTGQLMAIGALLALAAVAWWATDLRMAGMDAGPGTDPGAFGFFITTWVVMMAAMMFPSIAPMVLTYRNLQRGRRAQGRRVPVGATALFVTGYLAVWAASGLLGYAVLGAGRSLAGGAFAWREAGRWTAAALILVAALYEFTPLKGACLSRCRGPLSFLMGSWRQGRGGALQMGVEHGAWCLGCCWALMVALFALGAMSITWMVVIAALIALEKLLPWRAAGTFGVAGVLAVLAIGVAAVPAHVPGLTVPGSASAMRAMHSMSSASMSSHSMPSKAMPSSSMP
jgi:predicted metal-binding membrane protein